MGSFIYNGFASNLPVEYGDDAVMFLCIENNEYRCHNDHCHIGIDGKNVLPVALPIFGKADDYGFIEEPVRDYNYEWLCKIVDGDILENLKKVRHYIGKTIGEVNETLKKYEEKEKKYSCDDELNVQAKKYIELHDKLVGKLFGHYDAIVWGLERRDVYELFIRMDFEKPFMYGFHEKEEAVQIEPLLNKLIPIIEKASELQYITTSPFAFEARETELHLSSSLKVGIFDKDEEQKKKVEEFLNIISEEKEDLAHISMVADVRLKILKAYLHRKKEDAFDWSQYIPGTCNFVHFNRTLADTYGCYDKSIYGGQWPNFKKVIALHSEYAKIMRAQKKKSDDY